MEREILFRGKRVDNGKWFYGSYLFLHIPPLDWTGAKNGPAKDIHFIVDEKDLNYAVDPATVGQYTGMTDRNGVKIFEGDIVEVNSALYLVDWISPVGMFVLRYVSNRKSITDFAIIGPERCEVCGNIHDNPELLEVAP